MGSEQQRDGGPVTRWERAAGTISLHPVTRRLVEQILTDALPDSKKALAEQVGR